MKCPHCGKNVDVKLIKAPDNLQGAKSAPASTDDLVELMEAADARDDLNEFEEKFMTSLHERYEKYGARTMMMSDKQMAVLRKIANGNEDAF